MNKYFNNSQGHGLQYPKYQLNYNKDLKSWILENNKKYSFKTIKEFCEQVRTTNNITVYLLKDFKHIGTIKNY